ncbi:MAG: hypothetical protein A2231_04985 [Candidatus Firestonebacteria bacterium RIFOXYA2_FULL_40_8]|nr:MAG: hypothetical protein A2231_04985 [Candidatus Firestonebacteria bacterium RIFOXYA2_FULL_40_8]
MINDLIVGLILLICTGVGKVIYDNRMKIIRFLKRSWYYVFPSNFNIAISISFRDGLNSGDYYQEIKNNLLNILSKNNLENVIKIRDLSDVVKFNSKEEAQRYRNEKELDLIIWGSFSVDNLKRNGRNVSKLDLKFTFAHPDDETGNLGKMIHSDIQSNLAIKKYWEVAEENSKQDTEVLSNNMFDCSMYIVALTVKLFGDVSKSTQLFEALYQELERRNDIEFKNRVKPHLLNCYEIVVLNSSFNKNYKQIIEYSEKYLKISPNSPSAIASMAFGRFNIGEKEESKILVEELNKVAPRSPLTLVDTAFFRILEKKYDEALSCYKEVLKVNLLNFTPLSVVEFLSENYKIYKDPALLFGSGIMSLCSGDKELAKKDFQEFIRIANKSEYKEMVDFAKTKI